MTAGQHIDYDALALEALRGVVKACLAQVARTGLVGDHHFYIAFNTQAPGVGMSKRLKEKYPQEMTIVLQHRFWDLAVEDDRFEVKLTFDGIPERLVIPFKSVKVFYDPSVPYGLQFEETEPAAAEGGRRAPRRPVGLARDGDGRHAPGPASIADLTVRGADTGAEGVSGDDGEPARPARRRPERPGEPRPATAMPSVEGPRGTDTERSADRPAPVEAPVPAKPPAKPAPGAATPAEPAETSSEPGKETEEAGAGGAKIFDLSKFRGKK